MSTNVPSLAFVASQDRRVRANGVNSHSRNLLAALAAVGVPVVAALDVAATRSGQAALFASRLRGRLAGDPDRRALGDLRTRRAILSDAIRQTPAFARADVVHAQDFVAAAACLDALGARCPPLVLAHHVNGLPEAELAERLHLAPDSPSVAWAKAQSRRAMAMAARIVAVSPWAAEVLERDAGVARSRIAVVVNGVPVEAAAPDAGARVSGRVLAVGQLVERKGFDVLVEALALLARQRGGAALDAVVLGSGPEHGRLTAAAQALGAPVAFVGSAPADAVARAMREASLFVLPSRAENLPMALLEAMAAALPAVASDVGGVAAALTPAGAPPCGVLVPAGNAASLAEAVGALLDDPARLRTLGASAHARARAVYSTEAMARNWLAVYQAARGA